MVNISPDDFSAFISSRLRVSSSSLEVVVHALRAAAVSSWFPLFMVNFFGLSLISVKACAASFNLPDDDLPKEIDEELQGLEKRISDLYANLHSKSQ